MRYLVTITDGVDFSPENETAEILQNVRTILTTRKGECPLARDFGLSWDNVDKPLPVARSLMQAEIIDAIAEYEPRAQVVRVEFDETTTDEINGILRPRVIVNIGNEEEQEI